jgi:hypothetical protein
MEYYFEIYLLDENGCFIEVEPCTIIADSIDDAHSLVDEFVEEELMLYEYEGGVPDSYDAKLVDILG